MLASFKIHSRQFSKPVSRTLPMVGINNTGLKDWTRIPRHDSGDDNSMGVPNRGSMMHSLSIQEPV
jgi:hypothetical protein